MFNKIKIIIKREFLHRVRKRSFVVMCLLGPFIFAAMIVLPALFATMEDTNVRVIAVADSSHLVNGLLKETKYIKFHYMPASSIKHKEEILNQGKYDAILYVSHNVLNNDPVVLYTYAQLSSNIINHIQNTVDKQMIKIRLIKEKVGKVDEVLSAINSNVNIKTIKLSKEGKAEEDFRGLKMAVGYIFGFLIYMFIFLFGSQVMRGVVEEKTNRIVEIIVSSVKPFELMAGKIIGIGGVGLVQFIVWIMLTIGLVTVGTSAFAPQMKSTNTEKVVSQDIMKSQPKAAPQTSVTNENAQNSQLNAALENIKRLNPVVLIGFFLFYFIGGYLLYASMFAAIGSAVDSEADTQQFMFPVTIPLIFAIYVMINTINNPNSALSLWCSIIPFTSPVVMMVRIPFGIPYIQIAISAIVLIATFLCTTWMAGKIYRTGILMYGKKITYAEMWKWIKYRS
jgi:ABC-2 type transport system permease protein